MMQRFTAMAFEDVREVFVFKFFGEIEASAIEARASLWFYSLSSNSPSFSISRYLDITLLI
jgi:hypothetical protein